MMGKSHAISGAMVGCLWGTANSSFVAAHPFQFGAMLVITTGAALLPDADHPQATAAQSLKPVSKWACTVVGTLSGGHREGTHSPFGLFVFIAMLATFTDPFNSLMVSLFSDPLTAAMIVQSVAAGVCTALGLFALDKKNEYKRFGWPLAIVMGALLYFSNCPPIVTLVCITAGCLTHMVGDTITTQGNPWLWPFTKRKFRLPILGDAGSKREEILCWIMIGVCAVSLFYIGARCVSSAF